MKYAYYPGCSLEGTAIDYHESTMAVAKALGIELEEAPDWSCCGSTPAHCTDELLATALPAKNLLAAKTVAEQMVVCCSACFSRFKFAQKHLEEKPEIRAQVGQMLPVEGVDDIPVRHFLDVLVNDVGLEKVEAARKRELGLKVVLYEKGKIGSGR